MHRTRPESGARPRRIEHSFRQASSAEADRRRPPPPQGARALRAGEAAAVLVETVVESPATASAPPLHLHKPWRRRQGGRHDELRIPALFLSLNLRLGGEGVHFFSRRAGVALLLEPLLVLAQALFDVAPTAHPILNNTIRFARGLKLLRFRQAIAILHTYGIDAPLDPREGGLS